MKFQAVALPNVAQLPNGDFLLVLESCPSDDGVSTEVWSHYTSYVNDFNFSKNIDIIAANRSLNACAVVVRKKDSSIQETFTFHDPEDGEVDVTF